MRPVSLRWLLGCAIVLGLVLAACSSPNTPAQTGNPVVELDGFQAQIEMSKVDLEPMAFRTPQTTTYCTDEEGNPANVQFAQIIVPMLALDGWHLTAYVDVFWMPKNWTTHALALYAHGYLPPDTSLTDVLSQFTGPTADSQLMEARDQLLCEGYALGASTYSKQGYAIREGVIDTHLMNVVFPFIFRQRPSKTYVFGSSLGGLITVDLAENFSRTYAGAMPTCGPIGGSLLELNYVGNVRLLFDQYLNVDGAYLEGDLLHPGPVPDQTSFVGAVLQAVHDDTLYNSGLGFQALLGTGLGISAIGPEYGGPSYFSPVTLPLLQTPAAYGGAVDGNTAFFGTYSLLRSLRYDVVGAQDIHDRAGGWPFDNRYTTPTGTITPDASAIRYYRRWYEPTGRAAEPIPMLSMHNLVDADVPIVHEVVYALRAQSGNVDFRSFVVPAAGVPADATLLNTQFGVPIPTASQWQASGVGHCNFSTADLVGGFNALVYRAKNGSWPTSSAPEQSQIPGDFIPLDDMLSPAP